MMPNAVSIHEAALEPMTTSVDFEDDVEQEFQCSEEQRTDEFWNVMRARAEHSTEPRHRFTWQTALAVDELQCMPREWRRTGWREYLSVYAVAALQWPGDAKARLIGQRALLTTAWVRGFSLCSLELDHGQAVEPDRDSRVLLWRHPGVGEGPHGHVYADRFEEFSSVVDLPCLDERQVAQAHRLDAANFARYLAEVGISPSEHMAAWIDASTAIASRCSPLTDPLKPQAGSQKSHRPDTVFRGPLKGKTATEVAAMSATEIKEALSEKYITEIRVSALLRRLVLRIAKEKCGGKQPSAEISALYLEEHCGGVVEAKAETPKQTDWAWYMNGLPRHDDEQPDNRQPMKWRCFQDANRKAWKFALNESKLGRQHHYAD